MTMLLFRVAMATQDDNVAILETIQVNGKVNSFKSNFKTCSYKSTIKILRD